MIRTGDGNSQTILRSIRAATDGAETEIQRVLSVDGGVETEVYPPGCIGLRIETSFDDVGALRPVAGHQYDIPVINPLVAGSGTVDITVTPFPANAGWKLSSPSGFNLGAEDGAVHYGIKTLTFSNPQPVDVGYRLVEIVATPHMGDFEAQKALWWNVKYSESQLVFDYDWDFNDTLTDTVAATTLIAINSASTGHTAAYTDGYSPLNKALAAIFDAGATENPNVWQATLDVTGWETTGLSVAMAARLQRGGKCGFIDLTDSNNYSGNHLYIGWAYRQPMFVVLSGEDRVNPGTNASEDRQDYDLFHHTAIVLSPAIDVQTHPDITFTTTGDPELDGYEVTYTSPNVVYTRTITRTDNDDPLSAHNYFLIRGYLNGVLKGEAFVEALVGDPAPGAGVFTIDFDVDSQQDTEPEIIDRVSVVKGEMSAQDVASECAAIGISVDGGHVGEIPPENEYNPRNRENVPADPSAETIPALLKPFVIDDQTIAIAGVFRDFFVGREAAEFQNSVAAEENNRNGYLPDWQYHFINKFNMWDLYRDYAPVINTRFDDVSNFSVNSQTPTMLGRWNTSIGILKYPDRLDGTRAINTEVPDIAYYAYLRLPFTMTDGQTVTVNWMGSTVAFTYNKDEPSHAIKVNQVGYLPSAGRKYAYVGRWLGVLDGDTRESRKYNPADNPRWTGAFELRDASTGAVVHSGTATLRDDRADEFTYGETFSETGELVYELDFSSVTATGEYQIYVPGIGHSLPFKISTQAIGEQLFWHMRGLYSHRSGCPDVGPPYTNWVWGYAHEWTWESDFLTTFWQQGDRVQTPAGATYSDIIGDEFTMTEDLATGRMLRDVRGGWYDAADFDRRHYHIHTVHDLVEPYLRNPGAFTDGQLILPTSGNGIPDILDEAEWGLEVWRRGQREDGGVALWIECPRHEKGYGWESSRRYYLGAHCRRDSLNYAHAAAKLARAYRMVGTDLALTKSAVFTDSAIRAFNFGMDPAKTLTLDFVSSSAGLDYQFLYAEDPDEIAKEVCPAACGLLALTGDPRYAEHITDATYQAYRARVADDENSFALSMCTELLLDLRERFPAISEDFRALIMGYATSWRDRMESHPYRAMSWDHTKESWLYNYLAWGMAHPEARGRAFIFAWWMTGDDAWRDRAAVAMDFAVGCNPLGRSMTTGVGTIAPVHHLDGWLERAEVEDGIHEPNPGISPYAITGQYGFYSAYSGVTHFVYRPSVDPRSGEQFEGVAINLMPGGYSGSLDNSRDSVADWLKEHAPIWREACELEDFYVPGGEYTIWETVGGKAFMTAALLDSAFTADSSWAARQPETDRYAVPGLIFLP